MKKIYCIFIIFFFTTACQTNHNTTTKAPKHQRSVTATGEYPMFGANHLYLGPDGEFDYVLARYITACTATYSNPNVREDCVQGYYQKTSKYRSGPYKLTASGAGVSHSSDRTEAQKKNLRCVYAHEEAYFKAQQKCLRTGKTFPVLRKFGKCKDRLFKKEFMKVSITFHCI